MGAIASGGVRVPSKAAAGASSAKPISAAAVARPARPGSPPLLFVLTSMRPIAPGDSLTHAPPDNPAPGPYSHPRTARASVRVRNKPPPRVLLPVTPKLERSEETRQLLGTPIDLVKLYGGIAACERESAKLCGGDPKTLALDCILAAPKGVSANCTKAVTEAGYR